MRLIPDNYRSDVILGVPLQLSVSSLERETFLMMPCVCLALVSAPRGITCAFCITVAALCAHSCTSVRAK